MEAQFDTARGKFWIDDVLDLIQKTYEALNAVPDFPPCDPEMTMTVRGSTVSLALQFCLQGHINLVKFAPIGSKPKATTPDVVATKKVKDWSVLRPELRQRIVKAHLSSLTSTLASQEEQHPVGHLDHDFAVPEEVTKKATKEKTNKVNKVKELVQSATPDVAAELLECLNSLENENDGDDDNTTAGPSCSVTPDSNPTAAEGFAGSEDLDYLCEEICPDRFLEFVLGLPKPISRPPRFHAVYRTLCDSLETCAAPAGCEQLFITIVGAVVKELPADWIWFLDLLAKHGGQFSSRASSFACRALGNVSIEEAVWKAGELVQLRGRYITKLLVDACSDEGPFEHSDGNDVVTTLGKKLAKCDMKIMEAFDRKLCQLESVQTGDSGCDAWVAFLLKMRDATGDDTNAQASAESNTVLDGLKPVVSHAEPQADQIVPARPRRIVAEPQMKLSDIYRFVSSSIPDDVAREMKYTADHGDVPRTDIPRNAFSSMMLETVCNLVQGRLQGVWFSTASMGSHELVTVDMQTSKVMTMVPNSEDRAEVQIPFGGRVSFMPGAGSHIHIATICCGPFSFPLYVQADGYNKSSSRMFFPAWAATVVESSATAEVIRTTLTVDVPEFMKHILPVENFTVTDAALRFDFDRAVTVTRPSVCMSEKAKDSKKKPSSASGPGMPAALLDLIGGGAAQRQVEQSTTSANASGGKGKQELATLLKKHKYVQHLLR